METFIKALLQQAKKMSEISDLIEQIGDIVNTRKDNEEIDEYDAILDYYNIPPDNYPENFDFDKELPDPSRDLFCRDFFIDIIFDTIKGELTFNELDYCLKNWQEIFNKLDELYPNGIPGNAIISDIIKKVIKNE